ncbi:MAG: GEVED domain-containing protein, partial [Crocinitomicaceae bacterium]
MAIQSAFATDCPSATVIPAQPTLPYTQSLVCGSTNDITSSNVTNSCGSTSYYGGQEALYTWTPTSSYVNVTIAYTGVTYSGIFVFNGCPTSGGTCVGNVTNSATSKTLNIASITAGTTYYIMFDTWPSPNSPCPGSFTLNGTELLACSGTPTGGTTALTPTSGNPNSAVAGSVTGATVASGLTYQWQYSDDAGATWTNIVGQNAEALSTTAMSVYGTRDYRRATICGTDSAFSTPATFTTELTYCVPTTTYTGDYTSAFSTTNAVQNVTYTGSSNTAYVNKSGVDTIKAVIGNSFDFSHTYVGGSNTVRIWVDWNGDGTFDNTTEQVFLSSPVGGGATQTGTINIPGTVTAGNYRMRIRSRFSTTIPGPCSTELYGSAIDYTLLVLSLPVSPSITEAANPTCTTGAILSTTGTPGTNEAWYWQTSATGTDMTNDATNSWAVFTNGTYYVRAYNTVYAIWGDATSITVSDIPVATDPTGLVAAANPACVSTQISVDAAAVGQTNYWQGANSNGTDQTNDAATPYSVTTSGTYYVRAYDATSQCWSNSVSLAVVIGTVVPDAPIANPSQYNICSSSTTSMISADATIQTLGSLTTTTAGGNGCTNGNMFNITALTSTIEVNSFDIIPYATGTQTVNVYQKNGTYVGSETNSGAWTLIGSYPINGTMGVLYNLDIDDFSIPAGSTKGVYIDFNAQYTIVTAGTTYSNTDISVAVGAGLCAAFSSVNTPRAFNGNINYTVSTPSATVNWYDAATGGNLVGNGSPLEAVGTSVLSSPATNGEYHFYAESVIGGCNNPTRTLVTVYVND